MSSNSIELPSAGACAFCEYLSGARPFSIVTRDETTAVLVTREQRGITHLLVIPLRNRETILDLTTIECSALMVNVQRSALAIDAAYRRPGISIWQNNGKPASQSIRHAHFHVAGTLDTGGTEWGSVDELALHETEAIADRIRAHWA